MTETEEQRTEHRNLLNGNLDATQHSTAEERATYVDATLDALAKKLGAGVRDIVASKSSADEQYRTLRILEEYGGLIDETGTFTDEEIDVVLRAHAEFDKNWQSQPTYESSYPTKPLQRLAGKGYGSTGGSVGDPRNSAEGMSLKQVAESLGF